jgi:hypothetical protein
MGWASTPAPARAGLLAGLALDATRPTGSKESRKEAGFGLAVAPFLDLDERALLWVWRWVVPPPSPRNGTPPYESKQRAFESYVAGFIYPGNCESATTCSSW